jgi:hypothetical protein
MAERLGEMMEIVDEIDQNNQNDGSGRGKKESMIRQKKKERKGRGRKEMGRRMMPISPWELFLQLYFASLTKSPAELCVVVRWPWRVQIARHYPGTSAVSSRSERERALATRQTSILFIDFFYSRRD